MPLFERLLKLSVNVIVAVDDVDAEQSSEKRSEVIEQSEVMMQSAECTSGMWTTLSVSCCLS